MPTHQVLLAEPPGSQSMGSFGRASHMLIRQLNFPLNYTDADKLASADSDRLWFQDWRYKAILGSYVGPKCGDGNFAQLLPSWPSERFLEFCREVHKMPDATGCRVLGTVNVSNGHAIWTIETFQNVSGVEVFTGAFLDDRGERPAPNIRGVYRTSIYGNQQFCSHRNHQ